jgi:Zn-dependent peptidase ImmA (M78 family)
MNRIEKTVKKLLGDLNIDAPPVPVDRIAENLGATLKYEPFDFDGHEDISGMLYRDGETKIIGINRSHHLNRQRFSISHEIGHLLLHKKDMFVDKVVNFRDSRSSLAIDPEEMAANAFAAELLMPREFIRNEILKLMNLNSTFTKDELIKRFARTFKVSTSAMEYRLNNLGVLVSP